VRYLSLVMGAIWIGGLGLIGGVAGQAVFDVLTAHDSVSGRVLAGEVFGVVLVRTIHVLMAAGVIQLLLVGIRAALGPRPRRFKAQVAILLLMLGLTGYVGYIVAPRIDAIRQSRPNTPIASLAADDPVRREFVMLHGLSNGLLLVAWIGALTLTWFERRE